MSKSKMKTEIKVELLSPHTYMERVEQKCIAYTLAKNKSNPLQVQSLKRIALKILCKRKRKRVNQLTFVRIHEDDQSSSVVCRNRKLGKTNLQAGGIHTI